ncbi:MAG: DUF5329 family protein [Bdellovibrionales bacterium]|nr:DUF5329 family protein [Bdellovibrionales bacterium]
MKKVVILAVFIFSQNIFADWQEEKQKIDYLILSVAQLDAVFIRNGEEHSAGKAAEHLRMKLVNAQSYFWTPPKEKWTALMFIEKIASHSSISKKPYLIRFADSKTVQSGPWLKDRLKQWEPEPVGLQDDYELEEEEWGPSFINAFEWPDILDVKQVWQKWKDYYWDFYEQGNFIAFIKKEKAFRHQPMVVEIAPYSTDGCSSYPDGTMDYPQLWRSCCEKHDRAYWMGGIYALRVVADKELKECVKEKVAQVKEREGKSFEILKFMATMMESGVAIGGTPYLYTPWRWGYGWSYAIGYSELTDEQMDSVFRELDVYESRLN